MVLHVGLCKEIFARKHTATDKPTPAQSAHLTTMTHTHTSNKIAGRCGAPRPPMTGIPTTERKTEVRTTPLRSQECECQQCEETTVRMRQKCEGQVCEGQQCECDFSAIGQNSEVIQIERSRLSFCLQDGVFFSLSLSVCLSFSLGLYVRVRIRVGSLSPTDRQKTARESRSA